MSRRAARILAWIGVLACAVGLLSACTGSKKKNTSAPVSVSASPTPTPTTSAPTSSTAPTTPKPRPVAPVNPLTGVGAPRKRPVIAVKVDDTAPGRPQVNIDKADIVYIETAEGGLSRLVAIFGTNQPIVGYVRSTRSSDPELLRQYGLITLAASGGGGQSIPDLDRSGLTGWILDRGAGAFSRVQRGESSYINLTVDLAQVAARTKSPAAKANGYTWSPTLGQAISVGVRTRIQTVVGTTGIEFRWEPALRKYVRYIDGTRQVAADGAPVATPNVIIQSCVVTPDASDVDVNGVESRYTHSIGRGKVVVFRNGVAISGTWTRPNAASATVFRDLRGHVIPLTPGGMWIALAATGTPLTAT